MGLGRREGETLQEYRDRLRRRVAFSDGHLERITSMAARAAYSPHPLSRQDARNAVDAGRRAIRDVRRSAPVARRVIGVFRPGL